MDFEKTYEIPFPTATVYAAWMSSDTVIAPAKRMRVVPKVGGAYQLFMQDTGKTPSCQGKFSEVFANSRIRYSWQWENDEEVTDITVSFSPNPQGTQVTILHQGFVSSASHDNHAKGWDNYILGFTDFLNSQE